MVNSAAQTFPISKLNSRQKSIFLTETGELVGTNFSYTLDRMGILIWDDSFPYRDIAALGMAVTLADCQHSGNNP